MTRTEADGVRASQRAWVGHGAMHDDSPPRRLVRGRPATWEGEPFQEDTEGQYEDDWLFDDPTFRQPVEDRRHWFDS